MTANMHIPEWSLGDRLRKSRESAEISRIEMCEQLLAYGISVKRSTMSTWETDTARPGRGKDLLAVVNAWAEITNVPATWLLEVGEYAPRDSNPEPNDSELPAAATGRGAVILPWPRRARHPELPKVVGL